MIDFSSSPSLAENTGQNIVFSWFFKKMQPHHSHPSGASSSTSASQQPRHQRDEITSLETFRAILERGSSQSQDDASLKYQTSHISEESEEN